MKTFNMVKNQTTLEIISDRDLAQFFEATMNLAPSGV